MTPASSSTQSTTTSDSVVGWSRVVEGGVPLGRSPSHRRAGTFDLPTRFSGGFRAGVRFSRMLEISYTSTHCTVLELKSIWLNILYN